MLHFKGDKAFAVFYCLPVLTWSHLSASSSGPNHSFLKVSLLAAILTKGPDDLTGEQIYQLSFVRAVQCAKCMPSDRKQDIHVDAKLLNAQWSTSALWLLISCFWCWCSGAYTVWLVCQSVFCGWLVGLQVIYAWLKPHDALLHTLWSFHRFFP